MRAEGPRPEPDIERAPQADDFDAVLVPQPRRLCERQELLASDGLTLASRHGLTAGESWM